MSVIKWESLLVAKYLRSIWSGWLQKHFQHGRLCKIFWLKSKSALCTTRENSVNIWGPKLFNTMLTAFKNTMDGSLEKSRKGQDKYLQNVPNQPGCGGYVGLQAMASNILTEQRNNTTAWSLTKLWRVEALWNHHKIYLRYCTILLYLGTFVHCISSFFMYILFHVSIDIFYYI